MVSCCVLEIPKAGPECPAKVGTEKYAGEARYVGGRTSPQKKPMYEVGSRDA